MRVAIDQDQARLLGLSSQALSADLNTVMTGTPITQVRDDIYLVDVVTRAQDEQRVSLDTLQSLQIPLPNGRTVPLSQIARFDFDQEYPLVWRRDRVPTLTVQADVVAGATPEAASPRCAGDRQAQRQPAQGLPHRGRRHGRGERQVAGLGLRHDPVDAVPDAAVPDGAAAQLQPARHGAERSCRWA